jgi:formyl-CoA transferase
MVLRWQSSQGWDVPMAGIVPKFTATPGAVRSAGPTLGQHTAEVLRDVAGLSDDEIAELGAAGLL